jgi:ABC-type uncharacterized transport system substrate-binding protein
VLHELLPTAKRIGLLIDPQQKTGLGEVEAVGRDLGLELIAEEVRDVDGISGGIDALAAAHVEAINVLASAMFYIAKRLIIDRTRALRLPTMYWWADLVRDGGLIGYGPNREEVARLKVQQAVRVLKGRGARSAPRASTDPVRACDQPRDREIDRRHHPAPSDNRPTIFSPRSTAGSPRVSTRRTSRKRRP